MKNKDIQKGFIKIILSAVYIKQMFKSITNGFSRFFTKQKITILLIFIVLGWGLLYYSGQKTGVIDRFQDGTPVGTYPSVNPYSIPSGSQSPSPPVLLSQLSKPTTSTAPKNQMPSSGGYSQQSITTPSDLLPVDQNSQWSDLNPGMVTNGGAAMPDLLQAGYHIGLDTIGQTLRNPNYQLRSDPIIPKQDIGPWNQSTIEPDLGRVPLEVGVYSK
jgi:hypothetical protein